jgi:phenylalanyl-tRNA synthetase beta chain
MKISYNWLKWYIDTSTSLSTSGELPSPEKLEEIFTFKLCEVEGIEKLPDGDSILDLNILPNRAHDLLSHQGVARELAGMLGMKFKDPHLLPTSQEGGQATEMYKIPESQPTKLIIEIATNPSTSLGIPSCRRYMGRIVRNVKIGPSPDWVVKHLESVGQRSINNIVDATNLVMLDCGQPCHAFDAKKLSSEVITVRAAQAGEKITTLSGQEVELKEIDHVIADDSSALAIAGVKGGTAAEVDTQTTDIVIEVANFDPVAVRKTARRLNLLTDSAKRFENDLSPDHAAYAMRELTATILEMCPDAVFEDIVDVYLKPQESRTVEFSISWINRQLGTNLNEDEMIKILTDYGYLISGAGDSRTLSVSYLRLDLTGQHDIAEEVLRLYGLENIKPEPLSFDTKPAIDATAYRMLAARMKLLAEGYRETMTYTFRKKGVFEVARGVGDKSALRTNIGDGLRESFEMNKLNMPILGIDDLKLFEIGAVFPASGEVIHIALADKKNVVEMTLDQWCTEQGITISDSYESVLPTATERGDHFVQWSAFPAIVRDVALWVPNGTTADQILTVMHQNLPKLSFGSPRLFDTFTKGDQTSYAFRIVFQTSDRTLTDAEVDTDFAPLIKGLEEAGWTIR